MPFRRDCLIYGIKALVDQGREENVQRLAHSLTPALLPLVDPPLLTVQQIQQFSPATLAYLGDAIYELHVRIWYLSPPRRVRDYHAQVVAKVCAETQADQLRSLQPYLTDAELDVLRRGRNAVTRKPKRLNPEVYQQASSLETLLGYLYLTDPQRLLELLAHLRAQLLSSNGEPHGYQSPPL